MISCALCSYSVTVIMNAQCGFKWPEIGQLYCLKRPLGSWIMFCEIFYCRCCYCNSICFPPWWCPPWWCFEACNIIISCLTGCGRHFDWSHWLFWCFQSGQCSSKLALSHSLIRYGSFSQPISQVSMCPDGPLLSRSVIMWQWNWCRSLGRTGLSEGSEEERAIDPVC